MKRTWITVAAIVAALAGLVGWIAINTYWDEVRIPTGLKGEAATNPFYTAQRLAEQLGARTQRGHALTLPPADKGVIVLSYWHWSVIDSRRQALENWVAAGGRLVIDSTLIGGENELKLWTGLSRAMASPDEETGEGENAREEDDTQEEPDRTPLLFGADDGICSVLNVEPATAARSSYHICNIKEHSWIESERPAAWTLEDEDHLQAARVSVGHGDVTFLNATPFGNRELLEIDHAVLFVAVTQLRTGDEIVFLSEEDRASLLSLMWTYGAPAVVLSLVLLAVALWRGAVRIGPLTASPDTARRSIAEQIRGTGQFALRFGGGRALHAACVRALHETAERRVPGYAQLGIAQQIAAIARAADVDGEKLAETINHTGSRHAADLRNAVMVLEHTRRRLLDMKNVKGTPNAS